MTPYTTGFYTEQRDGSRRSAEIVLPIIFDVIKPKTLIDVGCGVGTWLGVARSMGVAVTGLDGDYVDRTMLEIPAESFIPTDVTKPIQGRGKFDLALCLEVGEHLPTSASEILVQSLVSLSEVVCFSAAIPMQGGNNHINEQWQTFWVDLFKKHGYIPVDFVRSKVWANVEVGDFYAQNIIVYCTQRMLQSNPALAAEYDRSPKNMFNLVHPKRYLYNLEIEHISTAKIMRALPGKVVRGALYKTKRLFRKNR